jgi:hypothetical protein
MATSGEKPWPPAGKELAASGEISMAIDKEEALRDVVLARSDAR